MASSGVLSINLAAVQENWLALNSRCKSGAHVSAVIKANAYGLGARAVATALHTVGCREFFFANAQEALEFKTFELKDALIYVLGGIRSGDEQLFIEENFIPVIFSMDALLRWVAVLDSLKRPLRCAIKINTGMTRLGLSIDEFKRLSSDTNLLKKINPTLIMSHLACADDPAHPLNHKQLSVFRECVDHVRKHLPDVRFSLANSSGIFLGDEWQFDLVRPGAALYGINPISGAENPLAAVVQLELPILQVRELKEFASIGYGAEAHLPAGTRLAVVAGGYADGLHKTIGMQPAGILCGEFVRAVGRMSMDLTIFDVTSVDMSNDELLKYSIEVINEKLNLDYLMKKNNTLGYDILTSLGSRYQRVYKGGDSGE